jgi:transcriptional regulator with XRE-family HTH domain
MIMTIEVKLSENLKRLSKKHKIRPTALARKVKANVSTIHNYFDGSVPQTILAIKQVADYFNISVDEINYGDSRGEGPFSEKGAIEKLEIIVLKREVIEEDGKGLDIYPNFPKDSTC